MGEEGIVHLIFVFYLAMPSKKSSHNQSAADVKRPSSPLFKEGSDPLDTVVSMLEKRARNLSKRKVIGRNKRGERKRDQVNNLVFIQMGWF